MCKEECYVQVPVRMDTFEVSSRLCMNTVRTVTFRNILKPPSPPQILVPATGSDPHALPLLLAHQIAAIKKTQKWITFLMEIILNSLTAPHQLSHLRLRPHLATKMGLDPTAGRSHCSLV